MIEPNFDLLLWFVFILYGVSGSASIINGALGEKKTETYGGIDVLAGLICILICFLVCIF